MRTGLILAGVNITVASALTAIYGALTNSPQLVGAGLSGAVTGFALMGAGTVPREASRDPLLEALRLLLNSHASVLESLDLLNHTVFVSPGDPPILVISKLQEAEAPPPGVGVRGGSPYLAIPLKGVAENVGGLGGFSEAGLRSALSDLIAGEYQAARVVDVEYDWGELRVTLLGVRGELRELQGYPLNPITLLILTILYRLTGRGVRLLDYASTGDGLEVKATLVT